MTRNVKKCDKCNKEISLSNFKRHYKSCGKKKKKLNPKWLQKNGKYKCPICEKEFSKYGIHNHVSVVHDGKKERVNHNKGKKMTGKCWNKGLTKETSDIIKNAGEKFKKNYKDGKFILGYKLTDQHKKKVSEGMKKAHVEGRAWNIGKSRWNNEPSYPEKFMMKVFKNNSIEYEREVNIDKYSIDFVIKNKKIAIEVDGHQHYRFEEIKNRDKEKNKLLLEDNWTIIRINWKKFFDNTKNKIETIISIINSKHQNNLIHI
jgi:very-short-patch-repair endonuclease